MHALCRMFGSEARKPGARGPARRPAVSYQISPTNYLILSEGERDEVLRRFVRIMAGVEKKLRVTIRNQSVQASYAGRPYRYTEKMVYFTSRQDLGPAIMAGGFKSTRLDEPVSDEISRERLHHMDMADGTLCRAYTVYDHARSISPAWINGIASLSDILNIDVSPVSPHAARRMLVSHANTLDSSANRRAREEAEEARHVNDLVQKQETVIYECGLTAMVTARDASSLAKKCAEFERQARWSQIRLLSVRGRQKATLDGWGHRFLYEGSGMAAFYPFESSDMIEADGAGGVYIGSNELTGTPVIYDYLRRSNYNMTILGSSGAGKSVAAKTYIDNFRRMLSEKYGASQPYKAYILDLHGEYAQLAEYLEMNVLNIMDRTELGLDPFHLLDTGDQAVDMLATVSEMPANLRSLAISRAQGAGSVADLVQILQNDKTGHAEDCRRAATYLLEFAEGELAGMFRGDLPLHGRTVVTLRNADKSKINAMLISLILQRIWNDIRRTERHVPKLLVIEEAWFVLSMPSTARIIDDIARSGRKENLHCLVMTQDIDEMITSPAGAAVIKNSATMMMLRLVKETAVKLQGVLALSDKERDEITMLDTGQAMVRADNNRIKLKVRPTPAQLKKFDTSAGGFTA
ncbi:ATPase/type IV secretory pathway component [Cenarchaeum symbiosum A]|uniref:ATPase/type IV secretory pathway component n=1 Tax=Cenarchaeum symbiosum (strain A) TaxID=414004 RepID=A0RVD5_CENSY|nr:ATPase/type IV secretory pathway component [Cenarchaeum symbiosum A]